MTICGGYEVKTNILVGGNMRCIKTGNQVTELTPVVAEGFSSPRYLKKDSFYVVPHTFLKEFEGKTIERKATEEMFPIGSKVRKRGNGSIGKVTNYVGEFGIVVDMGTWQIQTIRDDWEIVPETNTIDVELVLSLNTTNFESLIESIKEQMEELEVKADDIKGRYTPDWVANKFPLGKRCASKFNPNNNKFVVTGYEGHKVVVRTKDSSKSDRIRYAYEPGDLIP